MLQALMSVEESDKMILSLAWREKGITPNLPTKFVPTEIACLTLSGKFPMGLRIVSLRVKITYMRNLPGWLETRLAQSTLNQLKIAEAVLFVQKIWCILSQPSL